MFFKSIRFTLTLWYLVTSAVILLLFSTFLYLTISSRLFAEVDRELLAIAEAMASPTLEPFRNSAPSVLDQVLEDFIGPKFADKFVQISDASGQVFSRSKNLQDFRIPLDKPTLMIAGLGKSVYQTRKKPHSYQIRTIVLPVMANGHLRQIVQVGARFDEVTETLDKILLVLAVSIPSSLLLLWCGGWFLAGRALKPVDLVTRSAQKISAENLSHRLEVVNPNDEIGRLVETFNSTLDRLENSFIRTRRFSTDVSHELRTPLTILRGETEVGLRWCGDPDELKKILKSNLEEINRMSDIIAHLLELSRAEEGELTLDLKRVDLQELLQDLVQQTISLTEEKEIAFTMTGSEPVYVSGDLLRLKQIFLNLLDNALKFTPHGGEIRILLEQEPGWAKVSVIDSGPGIPDKDLPYIFDQFYRVDKARNRKDGGCGLGLSLVRSLSEAHGGRVELQCNPGGGCAFAVYLPTTIS